MHPILFKIGWFELHSYGLFLALAFLVGIYTAMKRAKKFGFDPNIIMNLSMVIIISSLIGSRFLYVIFHIEEFRGNYLDIINPVQSSGEFGIAGLTMLGGIIFALFSTIFYARIKNLGFLKATDILSPSVALGVGITRIGCFLSGCCYGLECSLPWGMVFSPESPAGYHFYDKAIHPTQLYSSLGGFIIFFILIYIGKHKIYNGIIFYSFLILYSIDRFIIDFFRYYEKEMILFKIGKVNFSVNQGICILLFLTSVTFITINYFRNKRYSPDYS